MSARHFEEVTPSRSAATSILAGFVSSLTAALITGCATVQTKPKADANLTEYRKVYVQTVEEGQDPRHVFPKVLNRLHQIGFDVQVVDKDHPLLAQGSGFVVDEQGHVLTCAHVLGAKTTNATAQVAGRRFE